MTDCDGKTTYQTKAAALRVFRAWQQRRRSRLRPHWTGGKLEVYECSTCRGWHIGHRAPREVAS